MKIATPNAILRTLILAFPFFSIIYTIYVLSTSNSIVDNRFYYGIGMYFMGYLGALQTEHYLTFLDLWENKLSTIALGLTLFLASFNVISFSHVEYGFSIEISSFPTFGFNPIHLIIFLLYLTAYEKELNEIFPKSEPKSSEQEEELFEKDVNQFIHKYEEKSTIELKEIISNSDSYCKSAVEASKRLLNINANASCKDQ